ncbi:MAG: hypothetical protein AAB512_03540 [Patescibacteria group bacterium]
MNLPALSVSAKGEKAIDLSKILIFAPSVIAIIASVAIGFLVVWPKFNEVLRLKDSNKTLEETAVKLEGKAEALSGFDKTKLRTQLSEAEQLLPSDKSIFTFIRQVEDTRNSSGVVITNLSVGNVGQFKSETGNKSSAAAPGEAIPPPPAAAPDTTDPAAAAGVSQVDMKLALTSDYRSILQFLTGIYNLPRVTLVKDLSLSKSADGGQLTTSLSIVSLWQPLPLELASVEAPLGAIDDNEAKLLASVESAGAAAPAVVPDVPKGKPDIFATF